MLLIDLVFSEDNSNKVRFLSHFNLSLFFFSYFSLSSFFLSPSLSLSLSFSISLSPSLSIYPSDHPIFLYKFFVFYSDRRCSNLSRHTDLGYTTATLLDIGVNWNKIWPMSDLFDVVIPVHIIFRVGGIAHIVNLGILELSYRFQTFKIIQPPFKSETFLWLWPVPSSVTNISYR